LKLLALQGKGEPKTRLSFPDLIMGLIKDSRMKMSSAVHEELKNPIDDDFIARYIEGQKKSDKGSKRASSSRAPQPQPEPQFAPPQPTHYCF